MPTANCQLVGILNTTPDSFSDGGKFDTVPAAIRRVKKMIKDGADIIDIGGESSGPGSTDVSLGEELERVLPVLQKLKEMGADFSRISIDTYKAEVARQALKLGAGMINDVTALRGDKDMAEVLGSYKPKVVLMYSKDATARTSVEKPVYENVLAEIKKFLLERVRIAIRYGIPKENIILDPGMGGFLSSDPQPSFDVINNLKELKELGFPVYIGHSRKSFLGGEVQDRLHRSLAVAAICMYNGADYLRVHDVRETRAVMEIVGKLKKG